MKMKTDKGISGSRKRFFESKPNEEIHDAIKSTQKGDSVQGEKPICSCGGGDNNGHAWNCPWQESDEQESSLKQDAELEAKSSPLEKSENCTAFCNNSTPRCTDCPKSNDFQSILDAKLKGFRVSDEAYALILEAVGEYMSGVEKKNRTIICDPAPPIQRRH